MNTTTRKLGLDIVRTFAIALVILIHAIGFSIDGYSIPLVGVDGFVRVYLRRLCFACVPLFLMLSGYLNVQKTNISDIWKRQFPRLFITYFFWSIAILIFNFLYQGEAFSVSSIIAIFNYSIPRAWYMDMYFGLLMLMPFINKCWKNMQNNEKKILLIALFMISFVSKYFATVGRQWFAEENYMVVISTYFFNASYIFYYLFGAWVHDCQPLAKKKIMFLGWQLILVLHTLYYLVVGWGKFYNDIPGVASFWYDNPFLAVESIFMFLTCYNLQIKNRFVYKAVTTLSILSFDIYLVSYIFDIIACKKLGHLYWKMNYYIVLLLTVSFSFGGSIICAYIKHKVIFKVMNIRKSDKKRAMK